MCHSLFSFFAALLCGGTTATARSEGKRTARLRGGAGRRIVVQVHCVMERAAGAGNLCVAPSCVCHQLRLDCHRESGPTCRDARTTCPQRTQGSVARSCADVDAILHHRAAPLRPLTPRLRRACGGSVGRGSRGESGTVRSLAGMCGRERR